MPSYSIAPTSGCVVVQAGGEIMKKTLEEEETLKIQSSCLVAFESSCSMINMPYSYSKVVDSVLISRGFDVQIKGPGTVYFSANTARRNRTLLFSGRNSRNRYGSMLHSIPMLVNVLIFSCFIFALSRLIEVEVIDHAREFHRQQQQ